MIYLFLLLSTLSAFATSEIKCEATYDQIGITHQKVNSTRDYYYCFGFHHGRDRAWEMDYFRRVAQGRNAEIYGFSWLKGDLMMRLLDLPELADRLYSELPQEQKDLLIAYSQGANLGFEEGKKAKEIVELGYEPEEWKPEHSILVLTLQSFDQTRKTFFRDFEEEKFKEKWKDKTDAMFEEDSIPWLNTILKEGEYPKKAEIKKTSYQSSPKPQLWANFPEVFGKDSGSNSWVVSKQKSKSGYAMLANDPHLDLKTPLFWYWINMESPEMRIFGASVPGVPIVVSGTNGKVAWGLTNAYINTADAVFIKDLKKEDIISFRPTVKVKFGFMKIPFFLKSFEKIKGAGKVIPLELEDNDEKMVLRWTGFGLTGKDLSPMFNLVHLKSVEDANETFKQIGLPAWNYVFADTKGDIGFRVVGEVLKENHIDPYGISYETLEEFKSKPLLDRNDRPNVLKPKRNYIYTANNRHWPADAKYYGGRAYNNPFRGFRIDELLNQEKLHDVESFKKIQCDRQAVDARFFVEKLLKIGDIPELKGWNFETPNDSLSASIYRRLMDLILEGWQVNEFALYKMLDQLDDKQKSEIMSFYKVAKDQVNGRSWGDFHRLNFQHLSLNNDWKFSPEIAGVGDLHSVDPGTAKWNPDSKIYEQYSGASMRMIIVMKEQPEIHLIMPGLNRNYTQPQPETPAWNQWRACEYNKISWQ